MYRGHKINTLYALGASLMVGTAFSPANAALAISNAATSSVSCVSNVCTATKKNAILNVTDLETMLASASVAVASAAVAKDIVVAAPLSWASASTLTFDTYRSLTVEKPVSVNGAGDLAIATNDGGTGGTFLFTAKGHIAFLSTTDSLTIDGTSYTLVSDIASLASDVAANPSGDFALTNSYNAKTDGTYGHSPIPTAFSGSFTGLGNAISNLKIADKTATSDSVGFFSSLGAGGSINNLVLQNATIEASGKRDSVGGAAGFNAGSISGVSVSGTVMGSNRSYIVAGGISGANTGTVSYSQSSAPVSVEFIYLGIAGGLIGENSGAVLQCFATGEVTTDAQGLGSGGMIGINTGGAITNSYATGQVFTGGSAGGANLPLGGLIGSSSGMDADPVSISASYATGAVIVTTNDVAGGFIGSIPRGSDSTISDAYWDKSTSGTSSGVGSGSSGGITGLTTAQLQSGLPAGFDPTIWAENSSINGGFPYLLANPPR